MVVHVNGQVKRNPPQWPAPPCRLPRPVYGEKNHGPSSTGPGTPRKSEVVEYLAKTGRFVAAPLCRDTIHIKGRMRLIGCAPFKAGGKALVVSLMNGSPWRSNSSPVATYGHSHLENSGSRQITSDKPVSAEQVALSVTESENSVLYVFFLRHRAVSEVHAHGPLACNFFSLLLAGLVKLECSLLWRGGGMNDEEDLGTSRAKLYIHCSFSLSVHLSWGGNGAHFATNHLPGERCFRPSSWGAACTGVGGPVMTD
jgi:hypothetical protein